jgi:hypothetical protein
VFKRIGDLDFTNRQKTVLAGIGSDRVLVVGTVMGERTKSSAVVAEDGGNTGDGTVSAATLKTKARVGTYTITFRTTGATAVADVLDPDGNRLLDLTVGTAYVSDHFDIDVDDGSADWTAGDIITIAVSGDGKVAELDQDAVNGLQEPSGILFRDITAVDGTDNPDGVVTEQDAIVAASKLVWPDDITADEKTAAIAALKEKNIHVRTDV